MKFRFAVFLGLLLTVSCSNSENKLRSKTQISNSPFAKDTLEQKADILTRLYNERSCKEFTNAFPDNFGEFALLYGYDDEKGLRLLYSNSEHITYFFECPEVSPVEKLRKSIEVGIDGKWESDLIAMFQDGTFNLVNEHSKETKEILNNLSDEKAASFWYFLFDSSHPNDKQNVRNFELMRLSLGKDSKQSKLLAEQFQVLRESDDGHGH